MEKKYNDNIIIYDFSNENNVKKKGNCLMRKVDAFKREWSKRIL